MDRIGLAAALFTEGEPEQGAAAAHQALDDATRVDSTLVVLARSPIRALRQMPDPPATTLPSPPAARISPPTMPTPALADDARHDRSPGGDAS
ncbi:hypothetical protein ACH4F6_30110 [Streptomyces sp. NPDC017936]|uniref:hypothetical protein n=1 Tax=Streptomyces sp. NPDC017936 TaxID=3365016 RepID=UPI0037AA2126